MGRTKKARKTQSQTDIKDAVTIAAGDTTAVTGTAAVIDGPIVHSRSTRHSRGCISTSSSNAQNTTIDAEKPRANSISAMELHDMATKQLLAGLESTIMSPRRVRTSVSSIPTDSHESTLAIALEKLPCSPVKAWSYSAGAMIISVFLVVSLLEWSQYGPRSVAIGFPKMHFWKHGKLATS